MKKIKSMKVIVSIGLMLCLTMSVGCSQQKPIQLSLVPEVIAEQEEVVAEMIEQTTDEDFEAFFRKYFALSEDDILLLNQNPSQVNGDYWSNHEAYKNKVTSAFGEYLVTPLTQKLQKDYLFDDFHFPRKLAVNGYLTFGPAVVEEVKIISTRFFGENIIYEVSVTTKNKTQRISDAYKNYRWHTQKNYYVKLATGVESPLETAIDDLLSQKDAHNAYLYLGDEANTQEDEIKLVHRYWVEAKQEKDLQIVSVKEASPMQRDGDTRQMAVNTSHIDRIAYHKEATKNQEEVIKKVFGELMKQPKSFYQYYDKAIKSDFGVFAEIWNTTLNLRGQVAVSSNSYETTFSSLINPYKDNIKQIEADIEKVTLIPSIYATLYQPRFIVHIPVKVLLSNNQIGYYNYKYYVGTEANKIEFIQLMNMQAISEAVYNTLTAPGAEVPAETAEVPAA